VNKLIAPRTADFFDVEHHPTAQFNAFRFLSKHIVNDRIHLHVETNTEREK
jgi:polyisoprenoid-binding protein YceI